MFRNLPNLDNLGRWLIGIMIFGAVLGAAVTGVVIVWAQSDEPLLTPETPKTAVAMRLGKARIDVTVPFVDPNGVELYRRGFTVDLSEPEHPPAARAEIIDAIKRLARYVGLIN